MLKKVLSSVILLAAVNASAGENYFANEWDAKGLIAIEGTGGAMSIKESNATTVLRDDATGSGSVSLKLGGETKFYRLFLAGTYYLLEAPNTTKSTAASLGLQIDYLIRAGEHFNIFMGINGGAIESTFEYDVAGTTQYVTNQNPYAGVQAGVNIDIIENLGLEFGGRAKHVFREANTYAISDMYEGYASIVFKFTGEY